MRTIQMTLEDALVRSVDEAVRKMRTTRSAFTRAALREALQRLRTAELEARHRRGYQAHPSTRGEFFVAEKDRAWGDE